MCDEVHMTMNELSTANGFTQVHIFNIPHLFSHTDSFYTVTKLMLLNTPIPFTLLPHLLGSHFLAPFSVYLLNLNTKL